MSDAIVKMQNLLFISLFSCGIFIAKHFLNFLNFKRKLRLLILSRYLTIEELIKGIESRDPETLSNFRKMKSDPSEIISTKVLLVGNLNSPNPLTSIRGSKLVYEKIRRLTLYSNNKLESPITPFGFVSDPNHKWEQYSSRLATEISLSDPENSSLKAQINVPMSAVTFEGEILDEIAYLPAYYKLKLFESLTKFVISIFWYILSIFRLEYLLNGIEIGYLDEILGVRIGTSVTLYANLIYNLKSKSFRIDTPMIMARVVDDIKESVSKNIRFHRIEIFKGLLVFTGLSACYYLIYSIIKRRRSRMEGPSQEIFNSSTIRTIDQDYDPIEERMQCILCCDKARSVVYFPCKHLISCMECERKEIRKDQCPFCRSKIEKKIPIVSN